MERLPYYRPDDAVCVRRHVEHDRLHLIQIDLAIGKNTIIRLGAYDRPDENSGLIIP